jgi:hypothetical protein
MAAKQPRNGRRNADPILVLALASGLSTDDAAKRARMCARTIFRRKKNPAFLAKVDACRAELLERSVGRFSALAGDAAELLGAIATDKATTAFLAKLPHVQTELLAAWSASKKTKTKRRAKTIELAAGKKGKAATIRTEGEKSEEERTGDVRYLAELVKLWALQVKVCELRAAAARSVIEMGLRGTDQVTIVRRLAALEERFGIGKRKVRNGQPQAYRSA